MQLTDHSRFPCVLQIEIENLPKLARIKLILVPSSHSNLRWPPSQAILVSYDGSDGVGGGSPKLDSDPHVMVRMTPVTRMNVQEDDDEAMLTVVQQWRLNVFSLSGERWRSAWCLFGIFDEKIWLTCYLVTCFRYRHWLTWLLDVDVTLTCCN